MTDVNPAHPFNVLFLCTGNSARSILAEVLMNKWGAGKFRGFSAGSHPKGHVNPYSIKLLNKLGLPTKACAAKVGTSLLNLARRRSISFSRFVTTQRVRCVLS